LKLTRSRARQDAKTGIGKGKEKKKGAKRSKGGRSKLGKNTGDFGEKRKLKSLATGGAREEIAAIHSSWTEAKKKGHAE